MTASEWWLIAGVVLQGLGFGAVGAEIAHRRTLLTGKPSILWRLAWPIRWVLGKLAGRPPSQTIELASADSGSAVGEVTVTQEPSWEQLDAEGKLDRLRRDISTLAERLEQQHQQLRRETKARETADQALVKKVDDLGEEVRGELREAVAGSIALETAGVFLFVAGLVAMLISGLTA